MSSQKKEYISWIDIAKGIGIILVVVGHINAYNESVKEWIYSFHMPLFFILSGLTSPPPLSVLCKSLIFNKIQRLLFPYVLWALIYCSYSIENIVYVLYGSYNTLLIAKSLTVLWFLPTMFMSTILATILFYWLRRRDITKNSIVLEVLFAILFFGMGFILSQIKNSEISLLIKLGYPLCIDVAFVGVGFILIGRVIKSVLNKTQSWKKIAISFVVCLFGSFIYLLNDVPSPFTNRADGYIYMARGIYGNPLIFVVSAIMGSTMIVYLSKAIDYCGKGLKTSLIFLGKNSLGILLVHIPLTYISTAIVSKVCNAEILNLIVVGVTSLSASIVIVVILNKINPQIIGNKNIK